MNVVTGGAGLVGQEIIKQLLAKGEKVTALYNQSPIKQKHSNLQVLQCDVLDTETLAEIFEHAKHVYHTAAIVSYSPHDRDKMYKTNVQGTANVANICNECGVNKLIFISSVAAIAKKESPLTEKMYWDADTQGTHYAKSKYLAEMEVWRAAAEGLPVGIINPSIILGCSDWNTGSSRIFKNIWERFPYYSEGVNGFVAVEDVAKASILLANSDITEERFIITESNNSFKSIFEMIANGFEIKAPHKKVTPFLAAISWRWEKLKFLITGKAPLITKETAKNSLESVFYSNDKFLESFPQFSYTPIKEAITIYCNEYKKVYNV